MYSESLMRYLIGYKSDELKPDENLKTRKKPLMIDLTGVKYVTVPLQNRSK